MIKTTSIMNNCSKTIMQSISSCLITSDPIGALHIIVVMQTCSKLLLHSVLSVSSLVCHQAILKYEREREREREKQEHSELVFSLSECSTGRCVVRDRHLQLQLHLLLYDHTQHRTSSRDQSN
jgi:hypothetical protein